MYLPSVRMMTCLIFLLDILSIGTPLVNCFGTTAISTGVFDGGVGGGVIKLILVS